MAAHALTYTSLCTNAWHDVAGRPRWRRPVSSSGRFVPGRRLAEWGWRSAGLERAPPQAAVAVGPAQDLPVDHQLHAGGVAKHQVDAPGRPAPPFAGGADPVEGHPAVHPAPGPDPVP